MKRHHHVDIPRIFVVLAFIAGILLLSYPTISNWWNSYHSSVAISAYQKQVSSVSQKDYAKYYEEAVRYNEQVPLQDNPFILSDERKEEYNNVLNISGDGIMGYVEIPKIDVILPVYHGTEEKVLQRAAGHLEWSSLPIGGTDSHCIISGHRGLPSASLFSNLDLLDIGDTFTLNVLNQVCTYEVDQIKVVTPDDTSDLLIVPGKDLCTLITCTPYGINTHRLLVRGHRIENEEEKMTMITANALQIDSNLISFILFGILMLLAKLLDNIAQWFGTVKRHSGSYRHLR